MPSFVNHKFILPWKNHTEDINHNYEDMEVATIKRRGKKE